MAENVKGDGDPNNPFRVKNSPKDFQVTEATDLASEESAQKLREDVDRRVEELRRQGWRIDG